MRLTIIAALLALIIALALPLALADREAAPTPSPGATPAPADAETSFSVKTGGEVISVSMADWLPGVVAGEMPASFEDEALRAQAVAARTYILSRGRTGVLAHPDADVCDDPGCCKAHSDEALLREKWGDKYDEYWARMQRAVRDTDGQYLEYGGEAIQALFHSSSAGRTEDSGAVWNALPYLVSVTSPETGEDVPNYVSGLSLTVTDFAGKLREAGEIVDLSGTPDTWVGDIRLDDSGRVESAVIGGAELTGTRLREIFGLRSTAFTLEYVNGGFTFTVTGYGHGVGMSQYGANVMAKEGRSYEEILAHYYPGTELVYK